MIQYARQAQIVFWKFLGAGDAAYGLRWGWWNYTTQAKSDIYNCLVEPCIERRVWECLQN